MIPETHKTLMKGVEAWDNNNKFRVVKLHWSADPTKNEDWADRESAKYGGRQSAFWRSEYEIDFGARRGGLVFPEFHMERHVIVPLKDELLAQLPKWRSIDPGLNHACACGWFTVIDGVLIMYRELKKKGWKVNQFCQAMKALSGKEEYEFTMIDSSAYAATLAGGGRSVADLFVECGVAVNPCTKGGRKRDQIYALAELVAMRDHGEPRFKITNNCPEMIKEILQYRWKEERDDGVVPEEPVKVDDDLLDTALYMAMAIDPNRVSSRFKDRDSDFYDGSLERRRSGYRMRKASLTEAYEP